MQPFAGSPDHRMAVS